MLAIKSVMHYEDLRYFSNVWILVGQANILTNLDRIYYFT